MIETWGRYAVLAAAVIAVAGCEDDGVGSGGDDPRPAVYAMTNQSSNQVVVYARNDDGTLRAGRAFATRGAGTNASLGSQGALHLTADGRWLLAANAGSDEITVFRAEADSLVFVSKASSGGDMPVSIDSRGSLVYVLNAGGTGGIAGFRLSGAGALEAVAGSRRALSTTATATMPAQVSFSNDGNTLVVTEKATNRITLFPVNGDGTPGTATVRTSAGTTPFGFAFAGSGALVVSEAFAPGGVAVPNASAVSTYALTSGLALSVLTPSLGTTETAACWIVITDDDRYVYTSNTGSGSITGYRMAGNGTLTRLDADGRTAVTGAGTMPVELALSDDSEFLYVLNTGTGTIGAYRVEGDGRLTALGVTGGLAANAYGMVAN